jgi:hypothetical protein
MVTGMARMIEGIVAAELLCVAVVVRAGRDMKKRCFGDVVSEDEMCDDELDVDKSWGGEEGRLLVSLYSRAGRPWPHEEEW